MAFRCLKHTSSEQCLLRFAGGRPSVSLAGGLGGLSLPLGLAGEPGHGMQGVPQGPHCPECGKVFSCVSNVRVHIRDVHGTRGPYVCHLCNKLSKSVNGLRVHMHRNHRHLAAHLPTHTLTSLLAPVVSATHTAAAASHTLH